MSLLDMIGPVMVGPSSSHTAGACRIGLVAHHLLGEAPRSAHIGLHASFAKTGRGHGTHLALVAGILGYAPDDFRLPHAFQEAEKAGLAVHFEDKDLGDVHPNTAEIVLRGSWAALNMLGSSTGGGVILVTEVRGLGVRLDASSPTLLLEYTDTVGMIARVTSLLAEEHINIATLTCNRETRGGRALLAISMDVTPEASALARLFGLEGVTWARVLPKLMDG